MKTLLTILVLTISVNIYGQELIMYDVDTLPELAYELADHKYELVQLLLPILNEYKQDCYNDSTIKLNKVYFPYSLSDTTYGYLHKKPTFAGFIEWLNKY